jgi:O-antigen/teichoic acid export membrane protein
MNFTRSSGQLFLANVATTALGLVGFVFFARELGPAGFGVFVLFQSLVSVVSFSSDLGFGSAVQKRISEGEDAPAFFASGALVKLILIAVTAVVLLTFERAVNDYVGLDVTVLLLVGITFGGFGTLMTDVLRGELRVGATAVLGVSRSLSLVVVGGLLVVAGFGPRGVIYGFLVGVAVKFLWGASRRATPLGWPSLTHVRSLFEFAKYDFVGGIGAHVFNWLDVLVIGWLLSRSAVGTYEVAWRVAGVTLLLSNALKLTIFPQVSEWHANGETDRIERLVNDLIPPSLFLVIPAVAGVALLARPLLGFVFGQAYADGRDVLVVLTGMKLLSAVHLVLVPCLLGVDRPDLNARATFVAVGVNLVLNVLFVLQFGVIGAAVATTLALAVNLALTARYLSWFVTIKFPYRDVGWCVVASMVMAAAIAGVTQAHPVESVLGLVLVVALGVVVYVGVVLSSRRVREGVVTNLRAALP